MRHITSSEENFFRDAIELFPRCNTLHETSDKKGGGLYHERGKVWKMQNVAEKQNFETQYIAGTKNFEDVIDVSQGV